ncbi:sigma-70 family RNA polymerase sigma factor [Mucilaginibacter sp.]|uniref:RNA polymerase sigma factor n=1 Tax=Mucilaginibacter sp. TaxID=1882438 RepID=UPI002621743F|nr:sigma-70 family RNA polymerase sigma factor [Mucilaginibacter sp.]
MNILIRAAAQREKLFIALYKNAFPSVAQYISKMGGSFDDAKDIFQDALVIYYEKAVASAIAINTNEKAYLVGISKHLWLRKFKDNSHNTSLDGIDITFNIDDDQPSESKLMHFLETAGKKCMELLRSFYYDQLPLADAAKLFGFSGVRSATVQKYKCLEKARETIKERSLTYEDFLN